MTRNEVASALLNALSSTDETSAQQISAWHAAFEHIGLPVKLGADEDRELRIAVIHGSTAERNAAIKLMHQLWSIATPRTVEAVEEILANFKRD